MKKDTNMSTVDEFEELKQLAHSFCERKSEAVFADAQRWKEKALTSIESSAKEIEGTREMMEKIAKLFQPGLICSAGYGPVITESDDEVEKRFQRDVSLAIAIMGDCIKTLKMRSEGCSPDRECILGNTHEQMMPICEDNPSSVVKEDVGPSTIISRSALSPTTSKALDAVMDAEDDRFVGTKNW